jgi:hypothetical protein
MSAMPTLRLGDPETARRYPLAVAAEACWQPHEGGWRVVVRLPELSAGTILLPSLASSSAAASPSDAAADGVAAFRHQWALRAGGATWLLQEVPAQAAAPAVPAGSPVSSRIDCFHVHQRLPSPELQLTLTASRAPAHYLICVSVRPVTIAEPPLPAGRAALARAPAPRSQMTAPESIASRICSPTCVSMVLDLWGHSHDWLALAQECHDPVSGLYGVWPLALAGAARRGCLGAVEAFSDWREPLRVLYRGVPLVTSIRFSRDELPGAPLEETGGHLVVVHAANPETILVCDPAAPEGEVLREYAAGPFSRAWLRHRGAAYILPP